MKLQVYCTHCGAAAGVKWLEEDRGRFARRYGETIGTTCMKCGRSGSYHVNDVHAVGSKWLTISALMVWIIGTPVILYMLWSYLFRIHYSYAIAGLAGVIFVPFMFYHVITREEEKKVRLFNAYKI